MDEEKLSPIKRAALAILDKLKAQVLNDCDEQEIVNTLVKFNPETNDYIKEDDYINADKAMRILGLGYNRNKFFALTKQYGIENKKINNMKIGFNRKEIEELACKLKTKH